MPRRSHRIPDLSARDFHAALQRHCFARLGNSERYIDLLHGGASILPVRDRNNRHLQRQATLDRMLAARREVEAQLARDAAERARMEAVASRIAPTAVPVCRADLTDEAAIAQLADDFLLRTTVADGVRFVELLQMGWSAAQLRKFGDQARALADRRAVQVAA